MADIDKIQIDGADYNISIAPSGTLDSTTSNDKFVSSDIAESDVNSSTYTAVGKIVASETHKSLFTKFTTMVKNIRVLNKILTNLSNTVNTINTRKATGTKLGQVTVGTGITVDDGKISVKTTDSNLKKAILDIAYPVGSIYLSINSTNPKNVIGGTWTAIGSGQVLATTGGRYGSVNSNYTGTTGVETIKLTTNNLPNHAHGITDKSHTHLVGTVSSSSDQKTGTAGAHSHSYTKATVSIASSSGATGIDDYRIGVSGGKFYISPNTGTSSSTTGTESAHSHPIPAIKAASTGITTTTSSGGKATPDSINVKPYTYPVYAWRRTA